MHPGYKSSKRTGLYIPGWIQGPSKAVVDPELPILAVDDALCPLFSADLPRQHDRLSLSMSMTAGPPCVGLFDIPAVPGVLDHMSLIPCHVYCISISKYIK